MKWRSHSWGPQREIAAPGNSGILRNQWSIGFIFFYEGIFKISVFFFKVQSFLNVRSYEK